MRIPSHSPLLPDGALLDEPPRTPVRGVVPEVLEDPQEAAAPERGRLDAVELREAAGRRFLERDVPAGVERSHGLRGVEVVGCEDVDGLDLGPPAPETPSEAERPRRPRYPGRGMRRPPSSVIDRLRAPLLGLAAACAACAAPPGPTRTTQAPGVAAPSPGRPVGRARNLRAGTLAYDLVSITRSRSGVRVEMDLLNGTSRTLESVALRVRLHGPSGEIREGRLGAARLRAGAKRRAVSWVEDVDFPVRDVTVELLHATP